MLDRSALHGFRLTNTFAQTSRDLRILHTPIIRQLACRSHGYEQLFTRAIAVQKQRQAACIECFLNGDRQSLVILALQHLHLHELFLIHLQL